MRRTTRVPRCPVSTKSSSRSGCRPEQNRDGMRSPRPRPVRVSPRATGPIVGESLVDARRFFLDSFSTTTTRRPQRVVWRPQTSARVLPSQRAPPTPDDHIRGPQPRRAAEWTSPKRVFLDNGRSDEEMKVGFEKRIIRFQKTFLQKNIRDRSERAHQGGKLFDSP